MYPRRFLLLSPCKVTHGLMVTYLEGDVVLERNNYWSSTFNKQMATNWSEIDRSRIQSLKLFWKGAIRVSLEGPELIPDQWIFSHTGTTSLKSPGVQILSRNIGYIKGDKKVLYRVSEETGEVSFEESLTA
jgi:hypothetical protein